MEGDWNELQIPRAKGREADNKIYRDLVKKTYQTLLIFTDRAVIRFFKDTVLSYEARDPLLCFLGYVF